VDYAYNIVNRFYENYGHRAKLASENKGIDWKAVSHAFRAAYQTKEILTKGKITFPLKNAEFIKEIKQGKYDYTTVVAPMLDELMDEVEWLSLRSTLPEKVDVKMWETWLINTLENRVFENES
jgi:hypothetical protein